MVAHFLLFISFSSVFFLVMVKIRFNSIQFINKNKRKLFVSFLLSFVPSLFQHLNHIHRSKMEMEKGKQIERRHLHSHPLLLVEAQGDEKEKADCSVCGELISESDSRFTCVVVHCNFHLHHQCSQLPYFISPHPFHPQHRDLFLRSQPKSYEESACAMCKEKCKLFFYPCYSWCGFCLCVKCFLSSWHLIDRENMPEYEYELKYELPFIFLKIHKDELKRHHCSRCQHSLTGPVYVSVGCKVKLHQKCFDNLPTELGHPCHRSHPLFLQFQKNNFFCEVCQKDDSDNLLYHCLACKFDIHLECIWPTPIIEPNRYHKHPFSLFSRKDPFVCDACSTIGKFASYICHTCRIQVHKNCTSLPRKIKVARHDHVLLHEYFLEKGEAGDCQICFRQVKKEYGSYRCWKEDCNFVVHVKCVLEDDSLYRIIDQENEYADDATESSITVIKKNDLGEAVEVRHFKHKHNLVLEDKIRGDDDRACDGCMLSISTQFYHCLECDFFLHKTCAELPRNKHHWFQLPDITLEAHGWIWCSLCSRRCGGLFYRGSGVYNMFCLRCATLPYVIKHEGHQHLLIFDPKCRGQCSGCGLRHKAFGAFRCKECSFSLDFACLTLPLAVGHKCEDHLLRLAYRDGNDDPEQFYCDICEEKRDPDRWYYSCSTCDNSLHSECALGKYPFIKDGATIDWFRCPRHHGNLSYVGKVVEGYPYCRKCGKPCQDEVVKCSQCNYILHLDCGRRT